MKSAVVIAYDGCLVDSLDARAFAVSEAMQAEAIAVSINDVRAHVAGRSLAEAVHAVANALKSQADATALDVASLRADRAYSALAARGLPLVPNGLAFIHACASRSRVVLRADSRRHDVSQVLSMLQLDAHISFVRCVDDGGLRAVASPDPTVRSATAAYAQICDRLASRSIAPASCVAYEPGAPARGAAQNAGLSTRTSIPE